MELRVLKYFVTIVQEKNISNAANVLHVSQSTLSRQIQELERELNTTLFERGKYTIRLTDSGQFLYSRAQEMLQIAESTSKTILSDEIVSGSLNVGVGENYVENLVAKAFKKLADKYPQVELHLHNVASDLIPDQVERGILDFGFAISQNNLDDFYQLEFNYQDVWGILVEKNSPLSELKELSPSDLAGGRLILSRQRGLIQRFYNWLGEEKDNLRIVGTYDMTESMHTLVKSGVGLSLTFDKQQYHDRNSQFVFIPLRNFSTPNSKLIWKKGRVQSKLEQFFLELMKQEKIDD